MAKLYCNEMRKSDGKMQDLEDIQVSVTERKINIRCHNGWRYITDNKSTSLSKPDWYGKFTADNIVIKDYIPNEMVGLIFEL